MTAIAGAALLVGATAAATDLAYRRIPNWLTLGGCLLGLGLHLAAGTWLLSLQGLGLALAVHLPLFALRWTSAGDVKLMAALGAIVGVREWLIIFVFSAVLGGIAALWVAWRHGRMRDTLGNVGGMLSGSRDLTTAGAITLPRGPLVALAIGLWWTTAR